MKVFPHFATKTCTKHSAPPSRARESKMSDCILESNAELREALIKILRELGNVDR
jgi:hypothetical protein